MLYLICKEGLRQWILKCGTRDLKIIPFKVLASWTEWLDMQDKVKITPYDILKHVMKGHTGMRLFFFLIWSLLAVNCHPKKFLGEKSSLFCVGDKDSFYR